MNKNAIPYKDTFAAAGSPLAIAIAESPAAAKKVYDDTTARFDALYPGAAADRFALIELGKSVHHFPAVSAPESDDSEQSIWDGVDYEDLQQIAIFSTFEAEQLKKQNLQLKELLARLHADITGLMQESEGVAGLHLNGDLAAWDELLPGGRFERLSNLNEVAESLKVEIQMHVTEGA
jgi:hypothetical protein